MTTQKKQSSTPRRRPQFPRISQEMLHWSALLEAELKTWPGVSRKPMFGFHSFYRGKIIFAAIPYSRGFHTSSSFILKFDPMPSALFKRAQADSRLDTSTRIPGKGWFSFELNSNIDLQDALWWLSQAYEAARQEKSK